MASNEAKITVNVNTTPTTSHNEDIIKPTASPSSTTPSPSPGNGGAATSPLSSSPTSAKHKPLGMKYLHNFPSLALLSIICIILIISGIIATLKIANHSSTVVWPWREGLTPNVAVSLCAVAINVLLRYVFSEGSLTSWWLTADDGATLKELEWSWDMRSISGLIRSVTTKGKKTNGMSKTTRWRVKWTGVATIILLFSAGHGVLLQRAVKFEPRMVANYGKSDGRTILVKNRLPRDFVDENGIALLTGVPMEGGGKDDDESIIPTTGLSHVFQSIQTSDSIAFERTEFEISEAAVIDASKCPSQAECLMVIRGIGLAIINSTHSRYEYTKPPIQIPSSYNPPINATGDAGLAFAVKFSRGDPSQGGLFTLDILYKGDVECDRDNSSSTTSSPSLGYHRQYVFAPAVVSYLVSVMDAGRKPKYFQDYSPNDGRRHGSDSNFQVLTDKRVAYILPAYFAADMAEYQRETFGPGQDIVGIGELTQEEIDYEIETYFSPELTSLRKRGMGWRPPGEPIRFREKAHYKEIYGGFLPALKTEFDAHALFKLRNDGEGGRKSNSTLFELVGRLAQRRKRYNSESVLLPPTNSTSDPSDTNAAQIPPHVCNTAWFDPTLEITDLITKLTFTMAVELRVLSHRYAPNTTVYTEEVISMVDLYGVVYTIDFRFVVAALVWPAMAVLVMLPMFSGWWKLKKRHTDCPVEALEAFEMVREGNAGGDVQRSDDVKVGKSDAGGFVRLRKFDNALQNIGGV